MDFEWKIFLSFSSLEGLGLPPVEAALAGNHVIGYTGEGGNEDGYGYGYRYGYGYGDRDGHGHGDWREGKGLYLRNVIQSGIMCFTPSSRMYIDLPRYPLMAVLLMETS